MHSLRDRSTVQTVLSTIAPLAFGLFATVATMVIFGDQHGMGMMPVVLVGCCVVLGISAAWLNRAVYRRTETAFPFMVGILLILLVWLWQRYAFTALVPHSGLTYGY